MLGKELNELPVHLHVLINHKMSPRGRIKLLVSLYFTFTVPTASCSPLFPHLRPYVFPFISALSFSKIMVSITITAGAHKGTEKLKI